MNRRLNISSPDAANCLSTNLNVSCENVQFAEVKIGLGALLSTGIITNTLDNNSRQNKVLLKSRKYILGRLYTV